ncbi:MAG: hypothetical protein SGILL_008971 [Bacillariaceae sp.]
MEIQMGPPTKKQRTLSPTSLAEFGNDGDRIGNDEDHLMLTDKENDLAIGSFILVDSSHNADWMDTDIVIHETKFTTKFLLSEYIGSSIGGDHAAKVQKGLGIIWSRMGGGEVTASYTMAVQKQRAEILNQGGHWNIAKLMTEAYPDNESIQIQCASILKELLLEGGKARYQVYCSGGMNATIAAMNRFPQNWHLQLCGCRFLNRMLLSPFSIAILEDLIRSTDNLETILRQLQPSRSASESSSKELHTTATNLLFTVFSYCPCDLKMELVGSIKDKLSETVMDEDHHSSLFKLLDDCESSSMRDEQYEL